MCAASFDFAAERGFIEASEDPNEILGWMSEYGQHGRGAEADGDDAVAAQFEELRQDAEDRVVALKAARLPKHAPAPRVERVAERSSPRHREDAEAESGAPRRADSRTAPVWGRDRDDSAERAADRAAADRRRADDDELHQLAERARKAEARQKAAEAATARILAEQRRGAEQLETERRRVAKERAEKELHEKERAAAEAEARTKAASQAALKAAAAVASAPAERATTSASSRTAAADLTPLARMFREGLIEAAPEPAPRIRAPASSSTTGATTPKAPAMKPSYTAAPAPVKPTAAPAPPAPVVDPDADLPPLTGADLTSFRTWLGASQRALAAKLAVEQSTISKGEGRPTTVLPPQLRRALHRAMGEPRADVGGAP